jgi:hypothetical protein
MLNHIACPELVEGDTKEKLGVESRLTGFGNRR